MLEQFPRPLIGGWPWTIPIAALGRAIGDGEAATGSRAGNDAPADASDAPRVAPHSASSSEDDRRA